MQDSGVVWSGRSQAKAMIIRLVALTVFAGLLFGLLKPRKSGWAC